MKAAREPCAIATCHSLLGVKMRGIILRLLSVLVLFTGSCWAQGMVHDNIAFSFANGRSDSLLAGPNPYVDIRRYNARSVTTTAAPAVPGITATISSGSKTATLSSASSFENGDWVSIWGAGATCSLSTPSAPIVTPSIAAAPTGTEYDVSGPRGSTTYSYKIVARDKYGCLTAASSAGSTSTGASSLGAQSVSITSLSRSNNLVTATVSSTSGLAAGAMVHIVGTSDSPNFGGWFIVYKVKGGRQFSFYTNLDTRTGATASATRGTAYYWNCNRLTWSGTSSAWEYYIYWYNGTIYKLIGVSRPNDSSTQDYSFDDFGSTMMSGFSLPAYVPTTAPSTAFPDPLSAQIVSGADTTTLRLSTAASNSVTNSTILFDDGPAIAAAVSAIMSNTSQGLLYIPSTGAGNVGFVVNSYLALPSYIKISQAGQLAVNETVVLGYANEWYGKLDPQPSAPAAFSIVSNIPISIGTANPGFAILNGNENVIDGITFIGGGSNAGVQMFMESGQYLNLNSVGFVLAGSGNYMGVGLLIRALSTNTTFPIFMQKMSFLTAQNGTSSTPAFICDYCGSARMDDVSLSGHGIFWNGGTLDFRNIYDQGAVMPILSLYGNAANSSVIKLSDVAVDTGANAIVANFGSNFSNLELENIYSGPSSDGSGGVPNIVTGQPINGITQINSAFVLGAQANSVQGTVSTVADGILSSYGAIQSETLYNEHYALGTDYSLFSVAPQPAAPNCSVATAGPPYTPAGSEYYAYAAAYPNGGMGKLSLPSSSACTSNGTTQQVTVTLPAAISGAVGYYLYEASTPPYYQLFNSNPITTLIYTVTGSPRNGSSANSTPGGGPAGMQNGLLWATKIQAESEATLGQCFSPASPAVCGSYIDGFVAIPATASTIVVDTTAVTANSNIQLVFDTTKGPQLGVTCNTTAQQPYLTAITARTSFTISVPLSFSTNPGCIGFHIKN